MSTLKGIYCKNTEMTSISQRKHDIVELLHNDMKYIKIITYFGTYGTAV